MTGRYYWRTSVKDGEVLGGNAPLHIETDRLTLGSLCKKAGYRTAAFGKWHLGLGTEAKRTDWSGTLAPGPLEIGFDYFFGLGSNPWSGPQSFIENHDVLGKISGEPVVVNGNREGATTSGIKEQWKEERIMETLTKKVTGWIEQNSAGPFFVYFAPNAIHRPITPNPAFTGSPFGSYGDFIAELDGSVGQVLSTLDKLKLAEKTLIIFSSDNGGVANASGDDVGKALEAGLTVNGPLRGGKHDEWEGGFREPFIVRWPGRVPAGTTSEQVICLTDVLATLARVLDEPLPKGQAEDSFDVLRAFTEEKPGPPVRDHVILQSAHSTYAIRMGDWKLIERTDGPPIEARNRKKAELAEKKKKREPQHDELYQLKDDVAESTDAYKGQEELAAKMKKTLVESRDRGFTRLGAVK